MPPDENPNSGGIAGSSGAPTGNPAASSTGSPASSGSSPSPGTSPSGGASESPSTGGESLDFESIFSGPSEAPTDLGLTEAPSQPPTAAPTAPPAAPSAPPQQQTQQPPQQAPAQAPPQQPQAPQQPPAADVAQGVDRFDPAALAAVLTQNEAQLVEVLSSQVLALTPQEVEALETNVVEAIPRLMARTLLQAQKSALNQMANILPVAIQRHIDVMRRAGSDEQNFYKAWPMLNRQKHGNLVYAYGSMFRKQFPQATAGDLIRHVGPMVMSVLGIPMSGPPGSPTAPGPRTNGRSPPPSPFVPAGGGGPVPGGQPRELQAWEAMFADQG